MIRSYRSKRRKIKEELAFLNNQATILNSVKSSDKSLNKSVPVTNNVLQNSPVPYATLTNSNVLDSHENPSFEIQQYQKHKQKRKTFIENPIVDQCVESAFDITNNVESSPSTNNVSDDSEILKLKLANWAIERNVAQNTMNDLLSILKQHKCFAEIPNDCRTLLGSSSSKTKNIRIVNPGNYYHFGLKKGIENTLKHVRIESNIKVVVGIDGLPLAKSSSSQFWPILAYLDPYKEHIFLIGLYHGYKKPADSNDFFKKFYRRSRRVS